MYNLTPHNCKQQLTSIKTTNPKQSPYVQGYYMTFDNFGNSLNGRELRQQLKRSADVRLWIVNSDPIHCSIISSRIYPTLS